MIHKTITSAIRYVVEDADGNVRFSKYLGSFAEIAIVIDVLSTVFFALFFAVAGLYLWNQGLSAAMPSVFSPIHLGAKVPIVQSPNPFYQLFITFLALKLLF